MVTTRSGDIFSTADIEKFDLAIVYGHLGYNFLRDYWNHFSIEFPIFQSVTDPFEDERFNSRYFEYKQGQWIIFRTHYAGIGISDADLKRQLETDLAWAHGMGLKTVITNGARNIGSIPNKVHNRLLDDSRTQFLIGLVTTLQRKYPLEITLMSLNDVFTRRIDPA